MKAYGEIPKRLNLTYWRYSLRIPLPPSLTQVPFPVDPLQKPTPEAASSTPWHERRDPEYQGIRQPLKYTKKLITKLHILLQWPLIPNSIFVHRIWRCRFRSFLNDF